MSILTQYLHVIGIFQGLLLAGLLIFGAKTSTASSIYFPTFFPGMTYVF